VHFASVVSDFDFFRALCEIFGLSEILKLRTYNFLPIFGLSEILKLGTYNFLRIVGV
jgi:hypothetical protein